MTATGGGAMRGLGLVFGVAIALTAWRQSAFAQNAPPPAYPDQIGIQPGVGPICPGPLGPGPCAAVHQYILTHPPVTASPPYNYQAYVPPPSPSGDPVGGGFGGGAIVDPCQAALPTCPS